MMGNHDIRLRKALITHFKAAYELRPADEIHLPPPLSPERLLGLQSLGIEWIGEYPDGEYWLADGLRVIHADKASQTPGGTAQMILKDTDDWTVFFHVHRREMASKTLYSRHESKSVSCFSPGCLCGLNAPGRKRRQNWQKGMALVDWHGTNRSVHLLEVCEETLVWDRRVFRAVDRVPDLKRDLPTWSW